MNRTPALRLPDGIDRQRFLDDFWQKKPLLMRKALPADVFAVDPDTLAGLACEDEIEARLIVERLPSDWQVSHGPFDEQDFASLPATHWTLLVQDVDKLLPEVARLVEAFDFVPDWRIDDIMISYASDQGGVGPHIDAYDVFLMQARGRRRWRLSHRGYGEDDLLPDLPLRILAHFETDEEYVLEPGDVLYLPPGLAHWGIAEGECMTWSLGFLAPSRSELAAAWYQHLIGLTDERHLADPAGLRIGSLSTIGDDLQKDALALIRSLPEPSSSAFRRWLGAYLTEPKPQFQVLPRERPWTVEDLRTFIADGRELVRHPAARLAWSDDDGSVLLFCQGECLSLPAQLQPTVQALTGCHRLDAQELGELCADSTAAESLILDMVNAGILGESDGSGG